MTKWILGLLAAAAIWVPAAQAQTTVIEPVGSHFPYQRWIDEAQVPTPDVTVEVIETAPGNGCPVDQRTTKIEACTVLSERKIWVAVPDVPGARPRHAFMHEVGHYFDDEDLTEWGRERFDSIYGLGGPWMLPESGQMTAGEYFAEAYAQCSVKPYVRSGEVWELGDGPIEGQAPLLGMRAAHNKTCRMIDNLFS